MSTFTDYAAGSAGSGGTTVSGDDTTDYWSLGKAKKAYLSYTGNKREEIDEKKQARRYRHGSHYTDAQIRALNLRKQPVVTYNRVGRKIDGIVGLVEKLRQDPKAYPRTPQHEQGAELSTAVLNFVLDQQDWKAKSPLAAEYGATDGIGGLEINLIKGKQEGDYEIEFDVVMDGFFYDPRSIRLDFSDAGFMGVSKLFDLDESIALYPDKEEELRNSVHSASELSEDSDREDRWFNLDSKGDLAQVRIVDLWYKHGGEWCYKTFTGSATLIEGKSFLIDEDDKTFCKYVMYSACVDQDGDRYGFVRNLKSPQDEINQRRSKGLHELNTRRIIGEIGAFDDVEKARREVARPDGMVLRNKGYEAEFDDTARLANIEGQLKFLEEAKAEIENFAGNPSLIETNANAKSGRAIALLQEGAIADLGPYILAYKGWKIRVYRAIWNTVQKYWTGERWVRVTDDDDVAQFIQINGMQVGPAGPQLVNAIGELDVDIILDEGPDHVNMMADAYDTLTVLAGQGAQVSPEVLLELAPLPASVKKRVKEIQEQAAQKPNPEVEAKQFEMQAKREEIGIKKETAAADMQIKQQEQAADFHFRQQEMALKRDEMLMEAQFEREKADIQLGLEREKAGAQIGLEREKATVQSTLERDKATTHADLEHTKMKHKVEGEKQALGHKVKDASNEAATAALKELTKALEGMQKAQLAPVKLIRDKSGKPVGAEKVV